jgi:hypothetical protein
LGMLLRSARVIVRRGGLFGRSRLYGHHFTD